jgi:hypothetical protein
MESMATERPALVTEKIVAGPRNGITIEKIEQNLTRKGLTRVKSPRKVKKKEHIIEGLDFNFESVKKGAKKSKMLRVPEDRDDVIIRRCWFRNKSNKDPALVISISKNVVVEDCIFENIKGKNEREPLRIGVGSESGLSLKCTVRRCIFRNNSGDDEVISIKSAKNTVEDCFFINNDANLTVRHGGLTKIRHNYFKGKNGVRIHGYGNRVEYNCFEDNSATDKSRSPISLWWGKKDKDPNWVWEDKKKRISKPSGDKAPKSHSIYAQTVDTVIRGNEFKKCMNTIVDYKKGDMAPMNTKKENNEKDVQKFTFETKD